MCPQLPHWRHPLPPPLTPPLTCVHLPSHLPSRLPSHIPRSFGRVYLANWRGVFVACKVLLMGGAGAADPQKALTLSSPVLRKLEEEASLLASLRHPNIVSPGSLVWESFHLPFSEASGQRSLCGRAATRRPLGCALFRLLVTRSDENLT